MDKQSIDFDSDQQKKLLTVKFLSPCHLKNKQDVNTLRQLWLAELKKWHSPYKALIDCQNLSVEKDS